MIDRVDGRAADRFGLATLFEELPVIIYLDANRKLQVDEPLNFTAFSFGAAAEQVLESTAEVEFDGSFAWIAESALRTWAPMATNPAWHDGLNAMVAFASPRGWVNQETGQIRAHIERR